jgi:hypothetical protein
MVSKASVKQNHGLEKRGPEWSLKLLNGCTFSNAMVSKTAKFVTSKHLLGFQNQSILLNRSILQKLLNTLFHFTVNLSAETL